MRQAIAALRDDAIIAASVDSPIPETILAAGIDGCRGGWIAALALAAGGDACPPRTELRLFGVLAPFLAACERMPSRPVVAIDMPMGLPARAGYRPCDLGARARLGRRRSSVFPPLDRGLLGLDFEAARAVVLARRAAARAGAPRDPVMTHQAVNLGPKIAELDAILRERPARQGWLVESHPELSFVTLRGSAEPPLPPKRTRPGAEARRELLLPRFPDLGTSHWPRRHVGADDVLDAYAVLWSALRHRRGMAAVLGGEPDRYGLLQRIVV